MFACPEPSLRRDSRWDGTLFAGSSPTGCGLDAPPSVHPQEARAPNETQGNEDSNKIVGFLMPFVPSSFLLLVVRPGAPSSVLAPSSDALEICLMIH